MPQENGTPRSAMYEALMEALKNRSKTFPDMKDYVALMNKDTMRKLNEVVMPKGKKDYTFDFGADTVDVQSSNFIEGDSVYLVPKQSNYIGSPFKREIKFDKIPDGFVDGFTREVEQRIWSRIASSFGLPSDLINNKRDTSNDWKRRKNESFSAWGMRLEQLGLIDDQTYRIAYQRAIQMAIITSPIRFVKWLLKLRIRKIE